MLIDDDLHMGLICHDCNIDDWVGVQLFAYFGSIWQCFLSDADCVMDGSVYKKSTKKDKD